MPRVDPPLPRAVIFDWDNTLVDSWVILHRALCATLTAMGREPWSMAETQARLRHSVRDGFPALFGERADEAEAVFYEAFEAEAEAGLEPLPGAGALLAALTERGIAAGVLSNKRGEHLRREVGWLGWDTHFTRVVGAGDAARDKPAIEAVRAAIPDDGGPDATVWLAGDTDIDLQAGRVAGCTPVLVRAEPPGADEFADAPPELYFDGCEAMRRWLDDAPIWPERA
ncbi:HAD family hydrolase [Limimonas halophila]|uniref:HAD family hydrolase n=1 Tax=Limimonas halophila TaxID=1082479 RepID=UPI000A6FCC8E|nr:HAD family hydrolase [Limimonas halophila]